MRKTLAAMVLVAGVMLPASVAAQDYPPSTVGSPTSIFVIDGFFDPGGDGDLTVGIVGLAPGSVVDGVVNSDPIFLPNATTTAPNATTSASSVAFFAFSGVPADFALNARHTVTITDAATGGIVGTDDFCVNRSGDVVACGTLSAGGPGGSLPRTGASDLLATMIQIGLAVLAVGTVLVLGARRRRSAAPATA